MCFQEQVINIYVGSDPITLHVAEWNQGALKLYNSAVFTIRSVKKINKNNYKKDAEGDEYVDWIKE